MKSVGSIDLIFSLEIFSKILIILVAIELVILSKVNLMTRSSTLFLFMYDKNTLSLSLSLSLSFSLSLSLSLSICKNPSWSAYISEYSVSIISCLALKLEDSLQHDLLSSNLELFFRLNFIYYQLLRVHLFLFTLFYNYVICVWWK